MIVSDSWGRAWRRGTVGVALGAAGLPALLDMRGQPDLYGRALRVTQTGFADEIAAAASLLMGRVGRGAAGRPGARPDLDRAGNAGRQPGPPRRRGLFR